MIYIKSVGLGLRNQIGISINFEEGEEFISFIYTIVKEEKFNDVIIGEALLDHFSLQVEQRLYELFSLCSASRILLNGDRFISFNRKVILNVKSNISNLKFEIRSFMLSLYEKDYLSFYEKNYPRDYEQERTYFLSQGFRRRIFGRNFRFNYKSNPFHQEIIRFYALHRITCLCKRKKKKLYLINSYLLDENENYWKLLKFIEKNKSDEKEGFINEFSNNEVSKLINKGYILEHLGQLILSEKAKAYLSID